MDSEKPRAMRPLVSALRRLASVPLAVGLFLGEGVGAHAQTTAEAPQHITSFSRHLSSPALLAGLVDPSSWSVSPILLVFGASLVINIAMLGVFFLMYRNQKSQGKGKRNYLNKEYPNITFDDVAGIDDAVTELKDLGAMMLWPQSYIATGAHLPKGILLTGPPGGGKTLLSKALAGSHRLPFFSISGSELDEIFVGTGASRVREIFDQAKKNAPCIVFIDEIDAMGRARGGANSISNERDSTLNQLLVEMDGFSTGSGVVVIAATNRPDILDPAATRPGRIDRTIAIGTPNLEGRLASLQVHTRNKPISDGIDWQRWARRLSGQSHAYIANFINESAIMAARAGRKVITTDDLELGFKRAFRGVAGAKQPLSAREEERVAYHEAGHWLAGLLAGAPQVDHVSVVPGVDSLGYVLPMQDDARLKTKSELISVLRVLHAGRIAEEIIYGAEHVSDGAGNDLARASQVLDTMYDRLGMSDDLGPRVFANGNHMTAIGLELAGEIDRVKREAHREFQEWNRHALLSHRAEFEAVAQRLRQDKEVTDEELRATIGALAEQPEFIFS